MNEPVLANLALDMGHIQTKSLYPQRLPDLFRGSQLTVLGRYETAGDTLLKLIGDIGGEKQEFSNSAQFPENQADHGFLPRLWAQRKVAYLVDEVRLNGENEELVNEIVRLSEKYGIMSPYTSFLVTEEERPSVVRRSFPAPAAANLAPTKGRRSFLAPAEPNLTPTKSAALQALKLSTAETENVESVKRIKNKTFYPREGVWTDSEYDAETETEKIIFGSKAYFDLIAAEPELSQYLAIGKQVIFCHKDTCYEILPMDSPPTTAMEKAAGTYTLVSLGAQVGEESVMLFPPEASGSLSLQPGGVSWQMTLGISGEDSIGGSGPSWDADDDAVHLHVFDLPTRTFKWTDTNQLYGEFVTPTGIPIALTWEKQ